MADWIDDGDSGSSVRAKLNTLPNDGDSFQSFSEAAINSSQAAPVTITLDPTVMALRVGVTSDGTGGLSQIVVLPLFPLDDNGNATAMNGYRVTITLDDQPNGDDCVLVSLDDDTGSVSIFAQDSAGNYLGHYFNTTGNGPSETIPLNDQGESVSFVWQDSGWGYDDKAANNSAVIETTSAYWDISGSGAAFAPPAVESGAGTTAALAGGTTSSGAGGDLTLDGGAGTSKNGLILIGSKQALPTSDPLVAGALWNSSGTLKISAG